ncbi:MAG TPA: cbb3-type cytochrome oxidase assembly protein CcoS [Polyangiaceae bacterium]|nr:cbb3-type cytochrome oxidase assembly protein CcoS [Polyangiaceae bacterium]
MSIIFLILPVTLLLSAGAVAAFAWATRSGQFDDLETPGIRLLHDESSGKERATERESDRKAD